MKDFEATVKAMSAKEIIMAMVEGLRKPWVKVDMDTFGKWRQNGKKVCYGCAATNTVCQIAGIKFTVSSIAPDDQAKRLKTGRQFLQGFEFAINQLRLGEPRNYNDYARDYGFAQIIDTEIKLPTLTNNYTEAKLQKYVELAEAQ